MFISDWTVDQLKTPLSAAAEADWLALVMKRRTLFWTTSIAAMQAGVKGTIVAPDRKAGSIL